MSADVKATRVVAINHRRASECPKQNGARVHTMQIEAKSCALFKVNLWKGCTALKSNELKDMYLNL